MTDDAKFSTRDTAWEEGMGMLPGSSLHQVLLLVSGPNLCFQHCSGSKLRQAKPS